MADDDIAGTSAAEDSGNQSELSPQVCEAPLYHEPPHSLGLVAHMWASPPAAIQLPVDSELG